MQLHIVRVLQHFLQGGDGSVVMLLQADDRALRTGEFLHGADAAHDIGCEILHDLLVDPQQRLTLGSVCKDEFGLAVDLYMGGKARAARAENTGVADQFIQLHPGPPQMMRKSPFSTQRLARVKDFALVRPSPVGVAMVSVV